MNPSFSIIIPTADRPQQLGRTLASLAPTARTVRRLEILVVDSGAPAATAETVAQFAQLYPLTRYIDEPVPGRLSGRHRGALEARGDVLAFLDDDVEVSPGWFTALQTIFSDDEVQLAGGPSLPRYAVRPPDWLDGLVRRDRQSWRLPLFSLIDLGPRLRQVDPRTLQGLNLAIRRQTVFDHGGFHPDRMPAVLQRWQGDGERSLLARLAHAGVTAAYHPGARVHHWIPAERLTVDHLEQCAARVGAADSFTALRREHGLAAADRRHWWNAAEPFGGRLGVSSPQLAFHPLQRRLVTAYRSGAEVHRREAARDARLRDWVLRPDYWDYRLPASPEPPVLLPISPLVPTDAPGVLSS
jgi:glycosyltransferase involved in cell wall biosynthesis